MRCRAEMMASRTTCQPARYAATTPLHRHMRGSWYISLAVPCAEAHLLRITNVYDTQQTPTQIKRKEVGAFDLIDNFDRHDTDNVQRRRKSAEWNALAIRIRSFSKTFPFCLLTQSVPSSSAQRVFSSVHASPCASK